VFSTLVKSFVVNTEEYEIHLGNKKPIGWELIVYKIEHSTKELHERITLKNFDTAYLYIKEKYLKESFNEGVFV